MKSLIRMASAALVVIGVIGLLLLADGLLLKAVEPPARAAPAAEAGLDHQP